MHDAPLLHVLNSDHKLSENIGGVSLFHTRAAILDLFDVLVEFLAWTVLHEEVDILLVFEEMIKLDNVGTL